MRRDDPFAGGVAPRLLRIDRELEAAARDAQCRDWVADRPDRVGFARLGQARHEVVTAARRYRAFRARITVLFPFVFLLVPTDDPLLLGAAAAAGIGVALAVRPVRRRRAPAGAAPIDDPLLYAGLRRRIEACAVAARGDRDHRRRAAAADLEYALDWLAAAQDELPRPVTSAVLAPAPRRQRESGGDPGQNT